jgi:hypothetical protein
MNPDCLPDRARDRTRAPSHARHSVF